MPYPFQIKSSSENSHAVLHLEKKQTNKKKITLYGRFNEEEIEEWWKYKLNYQHLEKWTYSRWC
ncbi:hypothetical protein Glove_41g134 [Diversispora epigaea]|uniref:Uncharacterized protein n=1 Tax=Diversispora epigaea TaxID=1348612 RepID=A0A397JFC3_9GLOM|nr:hypothetical protein Glove_41g134 [Diversispora epigaea]